VTLRTVFLALVACVLAVTGCSDDEKAAPPASSSSSASTVLSILVSDDDGVAAPGMDALVQALLKRPAVKVTVVAPAENQSSTGGKTSTDVVGTPAKTASGYDATATTGYPADAVNYALDHVFPADQPPTLVMTGANAGQNLGPFVDVSGTIGAARASAARGIVSIAISSGLPQPIDYSPAVNAAMQWLDEHEADLRAGPLPPISVFNLNAPTCAPGTAPRGEVDVAPDPIAPPGDALAPADCASTAPPAATDVTAFRDGFITLSEVPITPAQK
jgi:5'-nucleotidase